MSDAEYVAHIRRSVASWARWRKWLIFLYVSSLLAVVGLGIAAGQLMALFGQGPGLGFVLGLSVGGSLGFLIHRNVQGLADSMSDMRNERLLLQYHDAIREWCPQEGEGLSGRLAAVPSMGNDGSRQALTLTPRK